MGVTDLLCSVYVLHSAYEAFLHDLNLLGCSCLIFKCFDIIKFVKFLNVLISLDMSFH